MAGTPTWEIEPGSPTWRAVCDWATEDRRQKRELLERPGLGHDESERLRGAIGALSAVLKLADPRPKADPGADYS